MAVTFVSVGKANCAAIGSAFLLCRAAFLIGVSAADNNLYVWGFQLGDKPSVVQSLVDAKVKIRMLAVGSHNMLLST